MITTKEQRGVIDKRLWEWGSALNDCERRRGEIRDLQRQMNEMDDVLRGQTIDDMPKGTGVGNPTARALEVKEHIANRISLLMEEIVQIMQQKARMDALIDRLPENLQTLLNLWYVKRLRPTRQIPRKLNIEISTVYDWRDKAIEKIAKMESSETFGKNL